MKIFKYNFYIQKDDNKEKKNKFEKEIKIKKFKFERKLDVITSIIFNLNKINYHLKIKPK